MEQKSEIPFQNPLFEGLRCELSAFESRISKLQ